MLRYFNEISGLNIIIDPSVPSTPIDIVLRDVPWDQAFETLLRTHKLGYVAEGTIVRIAPIAVLAEEEGERRKLSEAKALAGDLRVQTFSLSYAKAEQMILLLTKSALSQRGQIQFDARTNTVIMTDLPDRLQTAQALITSLDRPEPQVEIEARVITTNREFARAIGVQWGMNGRMVPQLGNTTNLAFPNSVQVGGRPPLGNQGPGNTTTIVDLPAQSGALGAVNTAVGIALGSVNGAFNLDVALSALERSGKGRILSTPRVTTQNNVEAGDHARRADPGHDARDDHHAGHDHVQGCVTDAAGHAADHEREHRDHVRLDRELHARLAGRRVGQRLHQHAARRHAGSGQRRHDHGHGRDFREHRDRRDRSHAGPQPYPVARLVLPAGFGIGR